MAVKVNGFRVKDIKEDGFSVMDMKEGFAPLNALSFTEPMQVDVKAPATVTTQRSCCHHQHQ